MMKSVSEYLRNGAAVLLLLLAVLPASGQVKDRQQKPSRNWAKSLPATWTARKSKLTR